MPKVYTPPRPSPTPEKNKPDLGIRGRDDPVVHSLVLHKLERHLELRVLIQLLPQHHALRQIPWLMDFIPTNDDTPETSNGLVGTGKRRKTRQYIFIPYRNPCVRGSINQPLRRTNRGELDATDLISGQAKSCYRCRWQRKSLLSATQHQPRARPRVRHADPNPMIGLEMAAAAGSVTRVQEGVGDLASFPPATKAFSRELLAGINHTYLPEVLAQQLAGHDSRCLTFGKTTGTPEHRD